MSEIQSFSISEIETESANMPPDPTWDLERLASYTRERFEMAAFFGRKTALQLWLAGQALLIVKKKLTSERKWTVWAQEHDLPLTSVYEAIKIAERFETEDDITGLTPVGAKMIAGTVKPRPRKETKGDDAKVKSKTGVTGVQPRDEKTLGEGGTPDPKTATGSGDGGSQPPRIAASSSPGDWFERCRHELEEEVEAIESNELFIQEWASRQNHPMSSALLRVLIESEQITVLMDEGKEVVRVDDHDMIVALAAAETFLDPIFTRLGITPEIAARHLLEMIREGRGISVEPTPKSAHKKTRVNKTR